MAARLPKKAWGYVYTGFYIGGNVWLMMWAMTHAILWTLVMMHFTSQCSNIGTGHTVIGARVVTVSWGK